MTKVKKVKTHKNSRNFVVIFIIIMSIALLSSAVIMLSSYRDEIVDRTSSKAEYNTLIVKEKVEDVIDEYVSKAKSVANYVSECEDVDTIYTYVSSLSIKEEFNNVRGVRFYKEDKIYTKGFDLIDDEDDPTLNYRVKYQDKAGCVGRFYDELVGEQEIGFYSSVKNCEFCDGVVLLYAANISELFRNVDLSGPYKTVYTIISDSDYAIHVENGLTDTNSLYEELKAGIRNMNDFATATSRVVTGEQTCLTVDYNNKECILTIISNEMLLSNLRIVELFETDVLYDTSFDFIRSIVAIIILFAIINIAYIIISSIRERQVRRHFLKLETLDERLECNNRVGYQNEADRIISHNPNSHFYVILLELRHYKYLLEQYGESEIMNLLIFMNTIIKGSLRIEECCGHWKEGEFLLLYRENSKNELIKRLKSTSYLLSQYNGADKFDVSLSYGIYGVDNAEKISTSMMVDYAYDTIDESVQADLAVANGQYFFYSEELRRIRLANEDIEVRMDTALQNNEFQVFYQPKYNLNTNQQDGAEALVRWYDAKSNVFNPPALFLPLFESNGFVIKLDKFVFRKVCEYLSYSIASGRKIFPVSVNVSRLTATQSDFVRYYAKTKRDLSIPDGLIMIEFTESFAFDNYDELKRIIDDLHRNGLKVSLDDFGAGHSSYRTLKDLPIDEIKLDKLFLDKGYNIERDDKVLESIISLSKVLNIKVTQEGVEEQSEVDRMRRLGADVIQGFIYSKPIALSDYINFVSNTKEHKLD